ncbi:MAG: thiolase family protein [Hyphomicrobiaceae bacterium]
MASLDASRAYIIAARRSANGRIGGLHRTRRLAALAAPVIAAALADARIDPDDVDTMLLGNTTESANPARAIALAAGIAETANAVTIDQGSASGLAAILSGIQAIDQGDAEIVIAGGAESVSTAPWRIARPLNPIQLPRIIAPEPLGATTPDASFSIEAGERLASAYALSRETQDRLAVESRARADQARTERRFVGEIVPIRVSAEESRDQGPAQLDADEMAEAEPLIDPDGTLTLANVAHSHDGAAFVVIVSRTVWERLGRPAALRLVASAGRGVRPGEEATAPIAAVEKLYGRLNGFDRTAISRFELAETSAAQALAFARALALDESAVNPDGGSLARGHPLGASGAVLVVRLFSALARHKQQDGGSYAIAAQEAAGGLGIAAMFRTS